MRFVALSAVLAVAAVPAQAQRPCVTAPEAEALALIAMPEIIRETGRVCAARLPAASLVRRGSGPFIEKYEEAADRAWPRARAALGKLSIGLADGLLQSEFARPLIVSLVAPQLVGRIAVEDCGTVDRLVTQLEPLPPANFAGAVVTVLSFLKAERAKGRRTDVPNLPLCPAAARR